MRLSTRLTSDTTLDVLVTRLYDPASEPLRAAARAALLAANPLLANLAQTPVGSPLIVPEIDPPKPTRAARSPAELSVTSARFLLRALDEVQQALVEDLGDDAADASRSVGNRPSPRLVANVTRDLTAAANGAQQRHNESVQKRDAVPALIQPLRDDLRKFLTDVLGVRVD